jgi:hypothetical protein
MQYERDSRGGLDCILDLLTTLTYNALLHLNTAPSLISTIYRSLAHKLSIFHPAVSSLVVGWWRLLTMASPLLQNSSPLWMAAPFQQPILTSTVLLITPLHELSINKVFQRYLYCCIRIRCHRNVFTELLPGTSIVAYASVATGTCLLSCCIEMALQATIWAIWILTMYFWSHYF